MDEFDDVAIKEGFISFAHVYLCRYNTESESNERIDIDVYKNLVELDKKLGATASDQLFTCLENTTRRDIIKVFVT